MQEHASLTAYMFRPSRADCRMIAATQTVKCNMMLLLYYTGPAMNEHYNQRKVCSGNQSLLPTLGQRCHLIKITRGAIERQTPALMQTALRAILFIFYRGNTCKISGVNMTTVLCSTVNLLLNAADHPAKQSTALTPETLQTKPPAAALPFSNRGCTDS